MLSASLNILKICIVSTCNLLSLWVILIENHQYFFHKVWLQWWQSFYRKSLYFLQYFKALCVAKQQIEIAPRIRGGSSPASHIVIKLTCSASLKTSCDENEENVTVLATHTYCFESFKYYVFLGNDAAKVSFIHGSHWLTMLIHCFYYENVQLYNCRDCRTIG